MTSFLRVDFQESSNGESNGDVTVQGNTMHWGKSVCSYDRGWAAVVGRAASGFLLWLFQLFNVYFLHYWHSETVEEQFTVEHSYLMLYLNSMLPRAPVLQEIFIFGKQKIKEWLFWPFQMRQTQRRRGSNTAWMYRTRVCSAGGTVEKVLSFWWGSSQLLLASYASRLFYFIWSLAHLQVNARIYI